MEKAADMALKAIVGEKVAMSQVWVNDKVVPVTVLKVEPARIVQVKTKERDGYTALQVTYGHQDAKKLNKPEAGHFSGAGVQPGLAQLFAQLQHLLDGRRWRGPRR